MGIKVALTVARIGGASAAMAATAAVVSHILGKRQPSYTDSLIRRVFVVDVNRNCVADSFLVDSSIVGATVYLGQTLATARSALCCYYWTAGQTGCDFLPRQGDDRESERSQDRRGGGTVLRKVRPRVNGGEQLPRTGDLFEYVCRMYVGCS
jgi:hypothetical protein